MQRKDDALKVHGQGQLTDELGLDIVLQLEDCDDHKVRHRNPRGRKGW